MSTCRKVIILNGPPGIGKDTLAEELVKRRPFARGAFKDVLYEHTAKLINAMHPGGSEVTTEEVRERNEDRSLKERPWYGRRSVRRWLQITSENVVKPYAGKAFFGQEAAKNWYGLCCPVVVSDGGFSEEIAPVTNLFGKNNVLIVRLYNTGFDFGTDTRSYITSGVDCPVADLHLQRGEIDSAVDTLVRWSGELFAGNIR